jgi:hypothetical protein
MPRRKSPILKPPRSERQEKLPTASEEKAPSISVKSKANHFQSLLKAENSAIATVRTMLQSAKSINPTALDDYF